MTKRTLQEIRDDIDDVDLQLLRLLEQRIELAKEISEVKGTDAPLTDSQRESEMVRLLSSKTSSSLLKQYIERFFSVCWAMSKELRQRDP